jgi:CBS domain-containing protein
MELIVMNLKELLTHKQTPLVFTKASARILDAARLMCDHRVGSLLVQSDDGELLGILTERDILRFCSSRPDNLSESLIEEVMTRDLIIATPDFSVEEALSLMTEQRFRHLPVIEGGRAVGIVSIGDLVKARLKDVSVEVKYLRDYISA